jgi:hypothetical protein
MTIEMKRGVPAKFFFKLNMAEFALVGQCIKGAFEYEDGKFIVLVNGNKKFLLL